MLDSSVLIAFINEDHANFARIQRDLQELVDEGLDSLSISAITYTESLVASQATNKADLVARGIREIVDEIFPVDIEVAEVAAWFRAKKGLKTPDAIIAATTQIYNAILWTFDAQLAKALPGSRLITVK
jgi:predicted nucleic acid-binding protein